MIRLTVITSLLMYGCAASVAQSDYAEESCDAYEELALSGEANAQVEIANCYIFGFGRERDFDKGEKWLDLAIQNGSKTARVSLSSLILLKIRDAHRYELAIGYLEEAVKDGNPTAEFVLALAYRNGLGVPTDDVATSKYLELAARNDHMLAKFIIFGQLVTGERDPNGDKGVDSWRKEIHQAIESRGFGTVEEFKEQVVADDLLTNFVFSSSSLERIVEEL